MKFHENIWISIRIMTKGLTDRLRMERQSVDRWTDTPNNGGYYNHLWVAGLNKSSEKVGVAPAGAKFNGPAPGYYYSSFNGFKLGLML